MSPAYSARFSSDYLLNMCAIDDQGHELTKGGHLACQAYIAGVMDYHRFMQSIGAESNVDFCVPETESMGVIQQKVSRYLLENKHQQGPFIATPAVALGLFLYYPCDKKRR